MPFIPASGNGVYALALGASRPAAFPCPRPMLAFLAHYRRSQTQAFWSFRTLCPSGVAPAKHGLLSAFSNASLQTLVVGCAVGLYEPRLIDAGQRCGSSGVVAAACRLTRGTVGGTQVELGGERAALEV